MEMTKEEFTVEKAKDWLKALDLAHASACEMIELSAWLVQSCKIIISELDVGNVINLKTKQRLTKDIPPWPCPEVKNFQSLGKDIDFLCVLLNTLLPDNKK